MSESKGDVLDGCLQKALAVMTLRTPGLGPPWSTLRGTSIATTTLVLLLRVKTRRGTLVDSSVVLKGQP